MEPLVFGEKIRRPESCGLIRERLVNRLIDSDGPRLGLVLGPAGSGKTTLLSGVATQCRPSAWYRVTAEDDDEAALVRHIALAVGEALAGDSISACAPTGSLAELIGSLQQMRNRSCVLVIDDLHELAGSAAEPALERFLHLSPRGLRVLMAGRRTPNINISRLLVSGELCQLDTDDLRFRSWEVEELFRSIYQTPLSPSSAAALTRRTGGWAAGLQLFHLATSRLARPDRERAVDELSGRTRLIRSYLARNVVDGLSTDRRRFLLHTCTLGAMTAELCDELLDSTDSAKVLDELESEHFFTTSTDGGLTYCYHQVLQTHLEVVLVDELGSRAARDLYARSAALLERSGLIAAAIRAYARAEDWSAVARLAPQHGDSAPDDQLPTRIGRPAEHDDDPVSVLSGARRLLRNGQIERAVAAFKQAESLLDDPEFRYRCAAERAAAALWLPRAGGGGSDRTWSTYRDRSAQLSSELRQVTESLRGRNQLTTELARGLAALLDGDPATATRELEQAATTGPPDSWQQLAGRLAAEIAASLFRPNVSAVIRIDEIVLAADAEGLRWLSRIARGLQAALLLADRPTEGRIVAATEVVAECEQADDRWGACVLGCAIGSVHAEAGRADLAVDALRHAEEHARELGAPVLGRWAAGRRVAATHPVRPGDIDAHPLNGLRGNGRPKASPMVELRCLGGFALRADGVDVGWQQLRPRARALLMLLAVRHGHDVHREELIDALWPQATLTSGTRSLQVAASSIRHCLITAGLANDCVRRHGDAYALQLERVDDQLGRFEQLVAEASRHEARHQPAEALQARLEALDLYTGDLLPELGPADWLVEERDRLRALAGAVAADAARLAADLGDLAVGIRSARRSIELDPYHDPAWSLLITLQVRSGDRSAAAVTRREHARVCADLDLPV